MLTVNITKLGKVGYSIVASMPNLNQINFSNINCLLSIWLTYAENIYS